MTSFENVRAVDKYLPKILFMKEVLIASINSTGTWYRRKPLYFFRLDLWPMHFATEPKI